MDGHTCISAPANTLVSFSFSEINCYTDAHGVVHYYRTGKDYIDIHATPSVSLQGLTTPPCGLTESFDIYYTCIS